MAYKHGPEGHGHDHRPGRVREVHVQHGGRAAGPERCGHGHVKGGDLPERHTFEYRLTITVSLPSTSKVTDTPSVTWNDKGTGKADGHGFPDLAAEPGQELDPLS